MLSFLPSFSPALELVTPKIRDESALDTRSRWAAARNCRPSSRSNAIVSHYRHSEVVCVPTAFSLQPSIHTAHIQHTGGPLSAIPLKSQSKSD